VRSPSPADERGTVTAEFAVVLPAVLAVLALCVGGIEIAAEQVRLTSEASSAARLIAAGGDEQSATAGLAATVDDSGGVICVDLTEPARLGPIAAFTLQARECSLGRP